MKRWPTVLLGDLIGKSGTVDPSKFPDEAFDLYSIPAFDAGQPDIRHGSEIGSLKQVVHPRDVLLSRIVPHIRRAWIVGENRGRRLIASGEWIIFRSEQYLPGYLRYYLLSNLFYERFMQTVSGVGGSLLRARPAEVARIRLRKPPLGEQERIVKVLDEADELRKLRVQADRRRKAADRTRQVVKVEKLPEDQRELVAAFARRLDKVPAGMMAELKKIVLKSSTGEQPFYRQRRGIVVPPMSTDAIRLFAEKVRSAFVERDTVQFPIMDVIEFRLGMVFDGFYIDIRDKESMGEDEGRVIGGTKGIALREDIYEGAWNGNGRDRFTACHELGHFLMHRTITMALTREDTDKIFCDAEWQADTFAGTLLMSPRHLGAFSDSEGAAGACGMTGAAAKVMWDKYRAEGRFPCAAEMPRFI